ncbi:MAG: PH domain-containing protein [Clostridia bacterium]|nr:PH domain-containing protein [Clostridia bacterium]
MSKFVEENLNRNEKIIRKAQVNKMSVYVIIILGVIFAVCLIAMKEVAMAVGAVVFFAICANIKMVQIRSVELAVTDKRIVGKIGIFNVKSLDAPLNKIQNVSSSRTFWGKVLNYYTIKINTAGGEFKFLNIKGGDDFKRTVMNQIEIYEEERAKEQAKQMANAMMGGMNYVTQNFKPFD